MVAPCAGAWVEIRPARGWGSPTAVAPCAGAWVEILTEDNEPIGFYLSLPVRERGLKFAYTGNAIRGTLVAPCAGAWVEIQQRYNEEHDALQVAPCAGAWVEMTFFRQNNPLPIRRSLCGSVG